MSTNKFIKIYKKYLNNNSDSKRAIKEKAYLYSELKHYGVNSSLQGKFFKENKNYLLNLDKKGVTAHVKALWNCPSFEEKMMALNILNLHREKLDLSDMMLIEKLMRESGGWALLDNLVISVMPTLLLKHKKVWNYLNLWIKDDDFWVRRSAILAQLLFFRKGEGNKKLFGRLAKSQFDEAWIDERYKDALSRKRAKFFIRKAIGWTLREMSKKDPDFVYDFLKGNKTKMSGLTFREGSRKLSSKYRL